MLVAQKDAITKITGIITPESIDTLENKLGGAFTILKSTHFTDGQRYGFLATVIPKAKYRIIISNAEWVYADPVDPGMYSAAALVAGVSAAQQDSLVAQTNGVCRLSQSAGSGKGVTTLRCRQQRTSTPKKANTSILVTLQFTR